MNLDIKKSTISILLLISLFALLFERLYMPTGFTTGTYNKYITVLAISILSFYFLIIRIKPTKISILFLFITIIGILIHLYFFKGDTQEAQRYISLIIIGFLAGQAKTYNVKMLCRFIIIASGFFTFIRFSEELTRSTGFLMSSPTLFSFCLLIGLTYLIFTPKSKFDYLLILLGVFLVFNTGSRSTTLILLVLLLIRIINSFPKNMYTFILKIFLSIFAIAILLFIAQGILSGEFLNRDGATYSNMTRIKFLTYAWQYLNHNPMNYLIGSGAGTAYDLITYLTGLRVPLHFDFLTILIDYGIPGLIVMFVFPLFLANNWSWHGWILLFLGSIHNLLLFPIGLALVMLITNQLALEKRKSQMKHV